MVMVIGKGEEVMRNSENRKIGNAFDCGATTSSAMTKWMVLLGSVRQIGLGSTSHKFSDGSGDGFGQG